MDTVAATKKQKREQSVQYTQLPPLSLPHDTSTLTDIIIVQDVPDNSSLNINPLNIEDLKKMLL